MFYVFAHRLLEGIIASLQAEAEALYMCFRRYIHESEMDMTDTWFGKQTEDDCLKSDYSEEVEYDYLTREYYEDTEYDYYEDDGDGYENNSFRYVNGEKVPIIQAGQAGVHGEWIQKELESSTNGAWLQEEWNEKEWKAAEKLADVLGWLGRFYLITDKDRKCEKCLLGSIILTARVASRADYNTRAARIASLAETYYILGFLYAEADVKQNLSICSWQHIPWFVCLLIRQIVML